jgi:hypothetical protein
MGRLVPQSRPVRIPPMIREDREWLGPDIPITDHAEAFAIFLERAALRARSGEAVSEIADDILLPIRIAARRI